MTSIASAPAKVILLGEHAAVYGNPVLAATTDLRCYVTVSRRGDDLYVLNNPAVNVNNFKFRFSEIQKLKREWNLILSLEAIERIQNFLGDRKGLDISIESRIPASSGMGSSASIASALVLGISNELGYRPKKEEIAKLSWDIENLIHKKSSGVDPFSVTYGGIVRYQKGKLKKLKIREYPEITIGNTEVPSDTGKIVAEVMKLKENFPDLFDKYLDMMTDTVNLGQKFLEQGDLKKLGEIMNINHGLLSAIGVSSPELDRLVWAARKNALGAKLCGAGKGGIMIALGDASRDIQAAGGRVIKTKISDEGVRLEDLGQQ